MKTHYFNFSREFREDLLSGRKKATIRPVGKRNPIAGDKLVMRMWEGLPYRSKNPVFGEGTFTHDSRPVKVDDGRIWVTERTVWGPDIILRVDAQLLGFLSTYDAVAWYRKAYKVPSKPLLFEGILHRFHVAI